MDLPRGLRARSSRSALLLATLLPAQAFCQGEVERLSLEELLTVRVSTASKYDQTLGQAPSSVTVLTAADIRAFGWRTFADLLNSVRGVYLTNDHTYAFMGVRGFGRSGDYNGRVLVLVDGNRLNENVFSGANLGTEFPVDLELIDRVEFVSGPGSAIYGNNALFGVVNVITRRPAEGRSEVAADAGTQDTRRLRAAWTGHLQGGTKVLLAASDYRSEGWVRSYPEYDDPATPGGAAPRELDRDRVTRGFLRVEQGSFGFELLHADRKKGIPSASYGQVFGDTRPRTDDEITLQQATWKGALAPSLDLAIRQFAAESLYAGRYVYSQDGQAVLNRDETYGRWWGLEAKLVGAAPGGHRWVAGWEYQRNSLQRQFNYDDATGEVFLDDRRRSSLGSLYLQDEWTVREDLRLTAGVQVSTQGSPGSRAHPRLAAVWSPTVDTTVKAIYGSAFRDPNVYEAYFSQEGQLDRNPELRPELIDAAELILEQRVGRSTRVTAAAFRYRLEDLISLGSNPATGLLQYQNLSQADARGVELEAEHWFDSGARLKASLSFQQAQDGATGERLDNSPQRLAKVHLSIPVGWGERSSLGLEGLYVGERATVRGGRVGSYGVVNLTFVAAPWAQGPELSASVYNLFDRRFADPAAIEQFDSRGLELDAIPRDGRAFRFMATLRF